MISRGINFNLKAIFKKGAMGIILLMFFMSSVAYADNATILPEANINTSKTSWTIRFNTKYDKESINVATLYLIQEKTGTKVACTYSFPDEVTVVMTTTVRPIYKEKYSVIVASGVKSAGTKENLKIPQKKTFVVSQDLTIASVLPISDTITVMQNGTPLLPSTVDVLYKDGSKGKEIVTWSVTNTSTIGDKKVSGKILGLNLYASVNVKVVAADYIKNISLEYYPTLGAYLVKAESDNKVIRTSLNNSDMYYKGNNIFQLYTVLTKGSTVTFNSYDATNKLLGQMKYVVEK